MRKLLLAMPACLLLAAACAPTGDAARSRCLSAGYQAGSAELDACIRNTEAWMEQNRRLSNRIYTN